MVTCQSRSGFLRRKSPVSGVIVSVLILIVLLALLVVLFVVRSTLGLLTGPRLTKSVTTMLNDNSFREKMAETVVALAPRDTLAVHDVKEAMQDEKIAEAIGQLGSDWFSGILDSDGNSETDPVDAAIAALEDQDRKELYEDALEVAMKELDCTDEDLYDAAVVLSEEMGFEAPPKGSDNMKVVIAVLDGNRETLRREASEVIETVEEIKYNIGGLTSLLSVLKKLSGTLVFVIINVALLLVLYGIMILLLRNLWKPFYFLCVPYLVLGIPLICVSFVDFGFLFSTYDLPSFAETLLQVLKDSALSTGLIGVAFGVVMIAIAIAVKIIFNKLSNKKEETVCTVQNAEV